MPEVRREGGCPLLLVAHVRVFRGGFPNMRSAVLAFLLLAVPVFAEQAAPPATLEINGAFLARFKQHPNPSVLKAVRVNADWATTEGPYSVMDSQETPPSGTKHDYISMGPYWWPNRNTKNGLPYVRHDGHINPEFYKYSDAREIDKLIKAVHALGLGYYLTGKEEYAAHAVLLLRTWFLNPATRMNPNLNYAQGIPGKTPGRGIGIIDSHEMPMLLDGITLISGSRAFTAQDRAGLHRWFSQFLNWLQTSKNGRDESNAKNNHGSWYDQQVVGIALFLGDKDTAKQVAETAKTKRIALQIKADGSEPLELARTKSFSYSVFNLEALMRLAAEAQHVGVDLWSYRAPDGGSIRGALNYLLPYAAGKKEWTHQAINGVHPEILTEPLLLAAIHYHDAAYLKDAEGFEGSPTPTELLLQQEAQAALAGK